MTTVTLPGWQARALCSPDDTDLFFPLPSESADEAKRICASCPSRLACLDDALATGEPDGIRGGLDPDERRALGVVPSRPLMRLCDSGRHLYAGRKCPECEKEWQRNREASRVRDQSARIAARRKARLAAGVQPKPRTKGIAA